MPGAYSSAYSSAYDIGDDVSFQSMINQLQICIGSASIFTHGTAQIAIADDKVYTLGYSPVAVIDVNPKLRHVRESFGGGHLHQWHVPLTVGAKWTGTQTGPTNLNTAWQAVLDQICKYPSLGLGAGRTVREAVVESANLQPIIEDYGTIKFANVQLSVVIVEDITVQELE